MLAVFASTGEPHPPYTVELSDVHESLGALNGVLEIEPAPGAPAFPNLDRRSGLTGFFLNGSGLVGVAVDEATWGRTRRLFLSLDTGLPFTGGGSVASLSSPKLFVRQEGRRDRFELPIGI